MARQTPPCRSAANSLTLTANANVLRGVKTSVHNGMLVIEREQR